MLGRTIVNAKPRIKIAVIDGVRSWVCIGYWKWNTGRGTEKGKLITGLGKSPKDSWDSWRLKRLAAVMEVITW